MLENREKKFSAEFQNLFTLSTDSPGLVLILEVLQTLISDSLILINYYKQVYKAPSFFLKRCQQQYSWDLFLIGSTRESCSGQLRSAPSCCRQRGEIPVSGSAAGERAEGINRTQKRREYNYCSGFETPKQKWNCSNNCSILIISQQ